MKSKSIPNWKTADKYCPLLSCWAVDSVYNICSSYFTGHKNKYFQLNINTGHFSFPFRNGSCCHKPKCICDHSAPLAVPWGYQLPDTCGSKDAETPALLPVALFPFELQTKVICITWGQQQHAPLPEGPPCHPELKVPHHPMHFCASGDPFSLHCGDSIRVGWECRNADITDPSNER